LDDEVFGIVSDGFVGVGGEGAVRNAEVVVENEFLPFEMEFRHCFILVRLRALLSGVEAEERLEAVQKQVYHFIVSFVSRFITFNATYRRLR